jgi:hypothetical protein
MFQLCQQSLVMKLLLMLQAFPPFVQTDLAITIHIKGTD